MTTAEKAVAVEVVAAAAEVPAVAVVVVVAVVTAFLAVNLLGSTALYQLMGSPHVSVESRRLVIKMAPDS